MTVTYIKKKCYVKFQIHKINDTLNDLYIYWKKNI